jgi:hypothetical protein
MGKVQKPSNPQTVIVTTLYNLLLKVSLPYSKDGKLLFSDSILNPFISKLSKNIALVLSEHFGNTRTYLYSEANALGF